MVRTSQWERYLEEQKIKEKRQLEKEAAEKKRKDTIEQYAQKIKLERDLAEGLEEKLFSLEKPKEYRKLLRARKIEEAKKNVKKLEAKLSKLERAELVKSLKLEELPKLEKEKLAKLSKLEESRESKLHHELSLYYAKPKKRPEFILSEEDKAKCKRKTLSSLIDDISGSHLVCPPEKAKRDISQRELTADIKCFRKRVRRKSPEEIVALYDKLLADDPERLCKEKKE